MLKSASHLPLSTEMKHTHLIFVPSAARESDSLSYQVDGRLVPPHHTYYTRKYRR